MRTEEILKYKDLANQVRRLVLHMVHTTKSPHVGSAYSCVELLVALYFKALHISANGLEHPDRDRFIFSKGHACAALYAVLHLKGFLSKKDLDGFGIDGGVLEEHPTRNLKRGIEVSTGSLGHGLSVATGMALAAKKDQKSHRAFVLISDGELNEGSVWEAALFAAQHKLSNLVLIIDYNKMQAVGFPKNTLELEPLADKWDAFGWAVTQVDGHDFVDIFKALDALTLSVSKPNVIIAHTVKGRGVSFMENNLLWHYRPPDEEEYGKALKELSS